MAEPAAGLTRVIPQSDDGAVLYLQEPGSHVGKRSEHLVVRKDGQELWQRAADLPALTRTLNEQLQSLQNSGRDTNAGFLLEALLHLQPEQTEPLTELVLGSPDSPLAGCFALLVAHARHRDVSRGTAFAGRAVQTGHVILCRAVANLYCWSIQWSDGSLTDDLGVRPGSPVIELPRNLDSEELRFRVVTKEIVVPDRERIVSLLNALPVRLRLFAMLALNCAMNQVDIAALNHTMVDWENGRIKRKRVKTKKKQNVPEVDYLLWPETLELLKQCRPTHPELVLTTERGGKLVERMYIP